jgi:hypothetical protein
VAAERVMDRVPPIPESAAADEFRFQNDLVAFRCIVRLDGALIDTNAVKTFVGTT